MLKAIAVAAVGTTFLVCLAAIREHGPTPHHRCTWAPIAQPELPLEV